MARFKTNETCATIASDPHSAEVDLAHQQTTIMIDVVHHLLVVTLLHDIVSDLLADDHRMMITMTEAMQEGLPQEIMLLPHREDMKSHMTVGLLHLLLVVMTLTLVEIPMPDQEALHRHVAMAVMVGVPHLLVAIVLMMTDHIR